MLRPSRLTPIAIGLCILGACIGAKGCGEDCCSGKGGSILPLDDGVPSTTAAATVPGANPPAPALAPALPDFAEASWTRVPSRANKYIVCWRSTSGRVPRNEDFDLEVWVLKDGVPLGDALLSVNAWMPDHGHGMLRAPKVSAREDGAFVVEGMLLHMRGHWQLVFDVLEGSLSEAAECALEL